MVALFGPPELSLIFLGDMDLKDRSNLPLTHDEFG